MNDNNVNDDIMWMRRIVSHNVRMPMSIIRGYGDVLRQNLLDESEKQKAIDSICENIIYLDQIISVIFDNETTEDVLMTRVNISDALKKVTCYVSEMAKKNNIKVKVDTDQKDMYIKAELVPIMRIFYQIYENAFKYLVSGNKVSFRIHSADKDILIVYKDDGEGVGVDEVPFILDKGFRGRNSMKKSGSGFGLYEISEIVKKYGGCIDVKSRKEYGFSIFITFPKITD